MLINSALTTNVIFFLFLLFFHFGAVRLIKNFTKIELKTNSTILFFLQVTFFILLYVGAFETALLFHEPRKGDIGWGIAVYIIVWTYIFSSFVSSLILGLFNRVKEIFFLGLIFAVFACFPVSLIYDRPLRITLILICGFGGIILPYFIQTKLANSKRREIFD